MPKNMIRKPKFTVHTGTNEDTATPLPTWIKDVDALGWGAWDDYCVGFIHPSYPWVEWVSIDCPRKGADRRAWLIQLDADLQAGNERVVTIMVEREGDLERERVHVRVLRRGATSAESVVYDVDEPEDLWERWGDVIAKRDWVEMNSYIGWRNEHVLGCDCECHAAESALDWCSECQPLEFFR